MEEKHFERFRSSSSVRRGIQNSKGDETLTFPVGGKLDGSINEVIGVTVFVVVECQINYTTVTYNT